MKIAVISDVHGNLLALESVLADIEAQAVDVTVNLGDILSGPLWVAETADRLMALGLPTISGNHERQLLAGAPERMGASDAHAARLLDDRQRAWLAALPATLRLGDEVFCCHGSPASDLQYFLETVTADRRGDDSPGIRAATAAEAEQRAGDTLRDAAPALILCGHTHVPRIMQLGDGRLVVNPGSVGLQAYEDEHPHPHVVENRSPHARYAVLTRRRAAWQVELRCVPYEHEAAAALARAHGRPDWAAALRTGFAGRTADAGA